jgi:hypothetical protein
MSVYSRAPALTSHPLSCRFQLRHDVRLKNREQYMTREGGCLCGAVRFKTEGEPINVRLCHCRNCQKAMGSPFFARALFRQDAITVEGETGRYPTSERLDRVFCKTCGTRLFAWRTNGTAAGVALAAFDDRHAFAPTEHIWLSAKMDWVRLNDDLPQYQEGPPPS